MPVRKPKARKHTKAHDAELVALRKRVRDLEATVRASLPVAEVLSSRETEGNHMTDEPKPEGAALWPDGQHEETPTERETRERAEHVHRSAYPPAESRVAQNPGDGMTPDADHPDPASAPVEDIYTPQQRAERHGQAGEGDPGRVPDALPRADEPPKE